jgi:hypothetical protein
MNPQYAHIALRAGHRCEYCHAPEVVFNFPFEVEHIMPLSLGGVDHETNCALACRSCNLWKAAHIESLDPESGVIIRLFHPRNDHWDDHFFVESERGKISGRTSIGRATITCLRMNHLGQQMARKQWMRLDLFP